MIKDYLLCAILECGVGDLEMLKNINYDLDEEIDVLKESGYLSLNSIFQSSFRKGVSDLSQLIVDKINSLEFDLYNEEDEDIKEILESQIKELRLLDAESDTSCFTNCLDTHFYIEKNCDIYRNYFVNSDSKFDKRFSEIEKNMGFDFTFVE